MWVNSTIRHGPLFHRFRVIAVGVVFDLCLFRCSHRLFSATVFWKPVVVYLTLLLRYAANNHRGLRSQECVVVNFDRCSRNVCTIPSIASTVHIETVAERYPALDVVTRHVTAARSTRGGNRMAVPIELVVLDQ